MSRPGLTMLQNLSFVVKIMDQVIFMFKKPTKRCATSKNAFEETLTRIYDLSAFEIWFDKEKMSIFALKTYDSADDVYYGIFRHPGDDDQNGFIFIKSNNIMFVTNSESIFSVKSSSSATHILDILSDKLKLGNAVGNDAFEEKYLAHIPFCVCTGARYLDAFPLLLTGIPKETLTQCASPSNPQLGFRQIGEGDFVYQNKQTKREFPVGNLPDGAMYFDFVARAIEIMNGYKDASVRSKCIVLEHPDRCMAPPMARRFVRYLQQVCQENKVQVLLTAQSRTVRSQSLSFKVSDSMKS